MARSDSDYSESEEDKGRIESQRVLNNGEKIKFMQDVVEAAERDYDSFVRLMERERERIDNAEQEYRNSLKLSVHNDKLFDQAANQSPSAKGQHHSHSSSRHAQLVNHLLRASEQLLSLYQESTRSIDDFREEAESSASCEQTAHDDRERLKKILAAGHRMMERDMDVLQHAAQDVDSGTTVNNNNEAVHTANDIFGAIGEQRSRNEHSLARSLHCMEKGVKKMVKGLANGRMRSD